MWDLHILESYTAKIRDVAQQKDLSPTDRYNAIFCLVREIHCNSRMAGVKECKDLILKTIEKEI
jgi:hypothetical protein